MVGGEKSSASSWTCHLVMAGGKTGQEIQASRDFQPMLKRKKKSSDSHGGKLSMSRDSPQRTKRMVLNLQINQKHSPGN